MSDTTQNFSLEAKMQELRAIVAQMQSGGADFDTNRKLFTQGMALISECRAYLDTAELDVKLLTETGEQPFAVD